MKRRALIIYCDKTGSGSLIGPVCDNSNFIDYLTSYAGGEWRESEIMSLQNPTSDEVADSVNNFLHNADYTFTIFSGHGFVNTDNNYMQFVELYDKDISILKLKSNADRQTLIVDACRGFYSPTKEALTKGFSDLYENLERSHLSTRKLFDQAVLSAEQGWTVLYAASENESALDTDEGGAYLLSLLKASEHWEQADKKNNVLPLNEAHERAKIYLQNAFATIQRPIINNEKRRTHFPFAVKGTPFI